nr:reverse transcriptase domain-containing protein [Tanacetum cinerariifolium]
RTGMRSLRAVGSTIHSMVKFPTADRVATMKTSSEALRECRQIEEMQSSWKEVQWQRKGTWQVHVDYSSLNKVYAKDIYHFLKVEEKVGSLVGNQYRCFLRHPKEVSQDGGKKVLGLHGNGRRNKSRSKEGKGHTSRGYPRRSRAAMKPMLAADKHKSIHIKAGRAHVPISVNVVTDGPMEGMLKGLRNFRRLALWATDLKTYHISYVQRREAKEEDMDCEALLAGLIAFVERDKAILSGADNRPPMLEKDMYDSWKSRIELYMLNRQHGRMILESVEQGPLLWRTVEEDGVTRLKKYSELSAAEAIQADCDVKATNIILKGFLRRFMLWSVLTR